MIRVAISSFVFLITSLAQGMCCTDELCLDETEFQDQDDVQVLSAYIEHLNRQDEIELDEIDFSGDEQSGSTPSKFLFS